MRSTDNRLFPSSRRGFNLVEAAIVLGVVGLVIGGIWVGANALSLSLFTQKALEDALLIQNNFLSKYPKFAYITTGQVYITSTMYAMGIPPGRYVYNPTQDTLVSPDGIVLTIRMTGASSGQIPPSGAILLGITFIKPNSAASGAGSLLTTDRCINIVTRLKANQQIGNYFITATNSTTPWLQINQIDASFVCDSANTSFTFWQKIS